MLEEFENEQPIAYRILKNAIDNNKISHAYIFETNGYKNINKLTLAFVKSILCPNHNNINGKKCDCDICKQIDEGEFLELKIIDVDGNTIKKNEMDELQKEFSNKPVIGNKKIYIINNAEKLNTSSSNSILKFLEEPEEGIIAILIVDNIYQLLDTIISRCQIVSFKKDEDIQKFDEQSKTTLSKLSKVFNYNKESYLDFVNDENNLEKIRQIIIFITNLEKNKSNAFISEITNISNFLNNTLDIQFFLYVMIAFYKDVINYQLNLEQEYFTDDFVNQIKDVSSKNKIQKLCNKINILLQLKSELKINANTNLLIDRLILLFEGV